MQILFSLNYHTFFYRLCLPITIIFLSVGLVLAASQLFEQPLTKSHQGILDLSQWNTDKQPKAQLNGEWAFVWDELISTNEATLEKIKNARHFIDLPSTWNQMNYEGYALPGQGKATLLLAVTPPNNAQNFVIKVPVLTNQFQLYINGKLKVKTDNFGSSFAPLSNNERIQYISFSRDGYDYNKPIIFMFHLINHRHRDGGMWEALSITSQEHKNVLTSSPIILESSISFLLCTISILMLIRAVREHQVSFLYLAIFTALMAIRAGTVNERLFFTFLGIHQWQTQQTIEYLTIYATVPFFALYLGHRFPAYFPSMMHWLTVAICVSLMLLVMLTPAKVFSYSAPIFHLVVLLYIFLWLGVMCENIWKKEKGAILLLVGGLVFIIANINDILFTNNLISTTNLSHAGALVFVMFSYFSVKAMQEPNKILGVNNPESTMPKGECVTHPLDVMLQDNLDGSDKGRKTVCVDSLKYALKTWQNLTGKDKRSLAEETTLWRITNDGGTLKTRTFDKYLKLSLIPKNPRYNAVAKTLIFIAQEEGISEQDRYWLKCVADSLQS